MRKFDLSRSIMVRIFFILALVMLILISVLLLIRINRQVTFTDQANRTNLIRLYVSNILSKVQSAQASQRGFLLREDSAFLTACRQKISEISADFKVLDSLAASHDSSKKIDTLRLLTQRWLAIIDSGLVLYEQGGRHINLGALDQGRIVMDSLEAYADRLVHSEVKLLGEEQKLKERYTFITPHFVLLLILFTLFVFTFSYLSLDNQLHLSQTYLKQKQKALEELEDMNLIYQNAERVASLGSWQWDLRTNMFKCSDNLFRIYGSEPRDEEITFNRFMSFIYPADREKLAGYIENAIHSHETTVADYRIIRSDGVVRYMRAVGKLMNDRRSHIMLGAVQDVTEMTEAVEKLKESESFNRSITELVPNIIYIYDIPAHTMLYMNKEPESILGYTLEELTGPGFDFMKLFHPDDLELVRSRQERFRQLKSGEVLVFEYRLKDKNGGWISVYARTTSFKTDDKGDVTQIIGVASDITELKKAGERLSELNKELRDKNKELQQTNAELSSFNFIASHDLQEPLRKIQTFASFLEESEKDLSGTGRFYLQRMLQSVFRIRTLIRDILTYSHSTILEKEWGVVDLNIVLSNAQQVIKETIKEKNAGVQAQELPVVNGNVFQLQQLFENLLSNAFKYSAPERAPLVVISSETLFAETEIVPGMEPGRTYHKISFADNGIGFEQEYADKIFDLFQRLHSKSEYEGSGIGLSICKKIVQHHGGAIEARSVPGEGSVFDVYLPA